MSRSSFVSRLAVCVLLAASLACASSYHRAGIFGDGYSEEKLGPDRWLVTFGAGTFTSAERIERYLLLRSAEIAVDNNSRFFAVLSGAKGDFHPEGTKVNLLENPSWAANVVEDSTAADPSSLKGFARIVIQTYKGRPPAGLAKVYDAREVLEKLRPAPEPE